MYLIFSAEFLAKESPQVGAPNLGVSASLVFFLAADFLGIFECFLLILQRF